MGFSPAQPPLPAFVPLSLGIMGSSEGGNRPGHLVTGQSFSHTAKGSIETSVPLRRLFHIPFQAHDKSSLPTALPPSLCFQVFPRFWLFLSQMRPVFKGDGWRRVCFPVLLLSGLLWIQAFPCSSQGTGMGLEQPVPWWSSQLALRKAVPSIRLLVSEQWDRSML